MADIKSIKPFVNATPSLARAFPSRASPSKPALGLAKQSRPKSKSLQPCLCTYQGCGKTFSKRSNLKAHLRVHTGALPYPCEFQGCQKRFRWKSSLKPHVKIHMKVGDIPRDDCSAFVHGLIASLAKEVGPSNNSEISTVHDDSINAAHPFAPRIATAAFLPNDNCREERIHPDFVSSNSSASVAGTQETSPMFSVDGKSGRMSTVRNDVLPSAPSPTSVTDSHMFNMSYPGQEFTPSIAEECIEPFPKGYVARTSGLSQNFHDMPPFLPQGLMHGDRNVQPCARVLFPGNMDGDKTESDSSHGLPAFQPAVELSHPIAQGGKHMGSTMGIDLHCNSVLSSSQCSSDTEILSLTLDSMQAGESRNAGNPFDAPLFDSLQAPFDEFANIDLLPDAPVV